MIVVCNFFDKEIPMPLAKECEGHGGADFKL